MSRKSGGNGRVRLALSSEARQAIIGPNWIGEPILKDAKETKRPPEAVDKTEEAGEMTAQQVVGSVGIALGGMLPVAMPVSATQYRVIRKHPTVSLVRQYLAAPILAGSWSVDADEDAPDEAVDLIQKHVLPLRYDYLMDSIFGTVDWGWQAFEKIYEYKDGSIVITKLKPLLQDLTTILVLNDTGAFAGVRQDYPRLVTLLTDKVLLVSCRVEGTNWYGTSLLENVRGAYDNWKDVNDSASRFDRKIAGAHWVVHYPPGKSDFRGVRNVDNGEIADIVIAALESSGSIRVPNSLANFVDEMNTKAGATQWIIDIKESSPGQTSGFVDRLKYCDTQMVRSFHMPERVLLETEFGTKADAGTHKDLAVTNLELLDGQFSSAINTQLVDQLLALNFGPEMMGKVRIKPSPLVDVTALMLERMYTQILANPQGFVEEAGNVDWDAVKDRLDIPKSATTTQMGDLTDESEETEGGDEDGSNQDKPIPEGMDTKEIKEVAASLRPFERALRLAGFDPSQVRDESGRWTDMGGGVHTVAMEPSARFQKSKYSWAKPILERHKSEIQKHGRKVSQPSASALIEYQNFGYERVNGALRHGSFGGARDNMREISALDNAMITPAPESMVLYRGLRSTVLRGLRVGKVYTDKGFMSTSWDPDVALRGASAAAYELDEEMVLDVHVPKGFPLAFPSAMGIGGWRREREVILPRGTRYIVRSIDRGYHGGPEVEVFPPKGGFKKTKVVAASLTEDADPGEQFGDELTDCDKSWAEVLESATGDDVLSLAGFDPSQARDEDGKWTALGGGGIETHLKQGGKLPKHITQRIPPAWTDVEINLNPNARNYVRARDAKGRRQLIQNPAFVQAQSDSKFTRVRLLDFAKIHAETVKDAKTDEAAAALLLIQETGIRPGGEKDTGADVQSYGATTLLAEHVKKGGALLTFISGKLHHDPDKPPKTIDMPISDPVVRVMLKERAARAGKGGRLFNTDDTKLRAYTDKYGAHPKDFRTAVGTATAVAAIKELGPPPKPTGDAKKDMKAYKKHVALVANRVAAKLGNTPTIALQSYIDPKVFLPWRKPLVASLAGYDPSQPRDGSGRWDETGAGSAVSGEDKLTSSVKRFKTGDEWMHAMPLRASGLIYNWVDDTSRIKDDESATKKFESIIARAPHPRATLYHGAAFAHWHTRFAKIRKGSVITVERPSSWTSMRSVAQSFGRGGVVFKVKTNKAADIRVFNQEEGEFIVPRGTRFKVVSIRKGRYEMFVKLKEAS